MMGRCASLILSPPLLDSGTVCLCQIVYLTVLHCLAYVDKNPRFTSNATVKQGTFTGALSHQFNI